MTQPVTLQGVAAPAVDRDRVGVSYSGGGPLVLIELGCARAFIELGIVPVAIAGVSAGALAGTAHALDPIAGRGVDLAVELLSRITARSLGFDVWDVVRRTVVQRTRLESIADHRVITKMIDDSIRGAFSVTAATLGEVRRLGGVHLMIAATDRLQGTSIWFGDEMPIGQALRCSSAIPGVFPWQRVTMNGAQQCLVDGGVITNQPISQLVMESQCGTMYVCAVGYAGGAAPAPTNALNNVLASVSMAIHQTMKLEEDYVRVKLGDRGDVFHIHPEVTTPIRGYNFSRQTIEAVVDEARRLTVAWLRDTLRK
jgi:predicted acylesterase/phospholipase RssA